MQVIFEVMSADLSRPTTAVIFLNALVPMRRHGGDDVLDVVAPMHVILDRHVVHEERAVVFALQRAHASVKTLGRLVEEHLIDDG